MASTARLTQITHEKDGAVALEFEDGDGLRFPGGLPDLEAWVGALDHPDVARRLLMAQALQTDAALKNVPLGKTMIVDLAQPELVIPELATPVP